MTWVYPLEFESLVGARSPNKDETTFSEKYISQTLADMSTTLSTLLHALLKEVDLSLSAVNTNSGAPGELKSSHRDI